MGVKTTQFELGQFEPNTSAPDGCAGVALVIHWSGTWIAPDFVIPVADGWADTVMGPVRMADCG